VLTLLRELDAAHVAQASAAARVKKEDEEAGRPLSNYTATSAASVPENLRTVELEVYALLSPSRIAYSKHASRRRSST
jgi:hypothetical protein